MADTHAAPDAAVVDQESETPIIGEPMDDPKEMVRQARALVPVGRTGAAPMTLQQQVDYAQSMAKSRYALPEFLQGNVGDCLAVIDIATRAGLSPYMLAGQVYLDPKNKRIAFQSQAYHALAQGYLVGDFDVRYEGEGDDRICIVTGYLKSDPKTAKTHRSPRLGDVRPPKNENGVVKGSPLWLKKPDVQLFYDTSRDWVRMYAPRATLGIYTPDELAEYDMRDVTPSGTGLHGRLSSSVKSEEGHKDGHAEAELDNIVPTTKADVLPAEKPKRQSKRKAPVTLDQAPATTVTAPPANAGEYVTYARDFIDNSQDGDAVKAWWESESARRDELQVPISDRTKLAEFIEFKFGK